MEDTVWTLLLLLSCFSGASQGSGKCGRPVEYPDRRLEERFAQASEFGNEDRVAYKCPVGHRQAQGSRVSYCRDGQWTPLNMMCTRKSCGSAGDIVNGRLVQDGSLFGDKAFAECNEGYVLQGEHVRVCQDDGWSGTVPACVGVAQASVAIGCRHPQKVGLYNQTKPVYRSGEALSFSCALGHQPFGNFTTRCAKNKWTPALPRCRLVKCPELKILNGEVSQSRVRLNTTVKITCKDGFHLRGADLITCSANSSWTPAVPSCQPDIRCPPPAVVNGRTQEEDRDAYSIGEHVTIVCEVTFKLIGSPQITCGPNGQWQAVPECRPFAENCGPLPHYPNAIPREESLQGSSMRFKCNHGYRWAGGSTRIFCQNGRWTPLEMRCEKKTCGSAGEVQNGRFQYTGVSFGDTATAVCSEGYRLVGVGVRNCRAEGWDGRLPVCEVVQCPSPPEVPGGELVHAPPEPVEYRHVASYRCLSGRMIGQEEIYCTEHGTWSAPPPKCPGVSSCPIPHVINGAQIYGFRANYKPGDLVMFACNPSRRLSGAGAVTCGSHGRWSPALPQCV